MRITRGIAGIALLAAVLTVGTTARATSPITVGGTCVALDAYDFKWCTTAKVDDGTFLYAIVNLRPLTWFVSVCGQDPGGTCASAGGAAAPRTGTLQAKGCPCQGTLYVNFPDRIIDAVPYTGMPIGILTSLG